LVKYFNLTNKYPRIENFIQMRRKFQWYYFKLNFILIFLMVIVLFFFNIDAFFVLGH
jgi:hypothetical protein